MRVAYDLSILRHPHAGSARYATELLRAMQADAGSDEIVEMRGWPRVAPGSSPRRVLNLASELGWLSAGAAAATARNRIGAWFSPANLLPFGQSRPLIVTIHDSNVARARSEYQRSYATYAAWMFRSAGRRAAAVLAVSQDGRQQLSQDLGIPAERILVAYPGIDHATRVQPGLALPGIPARYALFVGQTEPHKNVDRLVTAWSGAVPADLALVIAGPPGRGESALLGHIAASAAWNRIHRVGRVSEETLARLYADATCFIFPSLAEGFGLPPLEAMARGIPTAVSDTPVMAEVTADAAVRFDPLDPESIADAVSRVAEDSVLRARLVEAGPRVAARYRWERTADVAWHAIRAVAGG